MLCLSRRPNESIIATTPSGERVTVTVLASKGNQVRIGVKAPASVPVHRDEIYARIKLDPEDDADRDDESVDGSDE